MGTAGTEGILGGRGEVQSMSVGYFMEPMEGEKAVSVR